MYLSYNGLAISDQASMLAGIPINFGLHVVPTHYNQTVVDILCINCTAWFSRWYYCGVFQRHGFQCYG